MELLSLCVEGIQSVAEYAASYRFGQSMLRQFDRALWVVEKCARWAVPPPLDQDERPPPPLVRPLPWIFFLAMLITLRVARESISLANLLMGKPPLRSADVVVFIQGKRRYLRTLKYQGNRTMRARSSQATQPWYRGLQSLFQLTMCFRRESHYGNNNNTSVTNNDEVMVFDTFRYEGINTEHVTNNDDVPVVKVNKHGRQETVEVPTESTMERLIEKMMVDLDAESEEDNDVTLTNNSESNKETVCHTSTPAHSPDSEISQTTSENIHFSPNKNKNSSSTPEKLEKTSPTQKTENPSPTQKTENPSPTQKTENPSPTQKTENPDVSDKNMENNVNNYTYDADSEDTTETSVSKTSDEKRKLEQNVTETAFTGNSFGNNCIVEESGEDSWEALSPPPALRTLSLAGQMTAAFINNEIASDTDLRRNNKKEHKIGRKLKIWSSSMKNLFHSQDKGKRSYGKECAPKEYEQKERSKSEGKLKRSTTTKSSAFKKFILKRKRTSASKEVISE